MSFDCDSDNEFESIEVNRKVQLATNTNASELRRFLETPEFINTKGNNTTNIIDRQSKNASCLNIPDNKIPRFFELLEASRRSNVFLMMFEKQLPYSGIMLDFDIYQKQETRVIEESDYTKLSIRVINIIVELFDIEPEFSIFVGITRKPGVRFVEEHNAYKDGIHMLIPGIQIGRSEKRFLIEQIIKNGIIGDVFSKIQLPDEHLYNDILDINSSHVGTHFIGHRTKTSARNDAPYDLCKVLRIYDYSGNVITADVTKEFTNANISFEFSINWECPDGIIKKRRYGLRPARLLEMKQVPQMSAIDEEEFMLKRCTDYDELKSLTINDHEASYIKSLLDVLNPERARDYSPWYKVICALASEGNKYKPLAEYFSKKCPEKYNQNSFDTLWRRILEGERKITIGSLIFWAREDNKARFDAVEKENVHRYIIDYIYSERTHGSLENWEIAKILYLCHKHKYVYDMREGARNGAWYEFIMENDRFGEGEIYKWKNHGAKSAPDSLYIYISETLQTIFSKILGKIEAKKDKAVGPAHEYFKKIYKNFWITMRKLSQTQFKINVIRESRTLFTSYGFADSLDMDSDLLGVGNGVLKLGKSIELIRGYHTYRVSRFTKTIYRPFNPRNPYTKKLLYALRNVFPDDEPDSHEFMMSYFSSALDARIKESMIMLLVGKGSNGKTVLVELFNATMGEHYAVKLPVQFLTSSSKNAENATPALMKLQYSHLTSYSETRPSDCLQTHHMKVITGQETLAGRNLHESVKNFKPHCHHLVTSNYNFIVNGTDHGTWRRIYYLIMRITFRLPNEAMSEDNPYERRADMEVSEEWCNSPEYKSAYLSILCFYYLRLRNKYGGLVQNVPHPHIKKYTAEFRKSQDVIHRFLVESLVKCVDEDYTMPFTDVVLKYNTWFSTSYPNDRSLHKRANEQLENSALCKLLITNARGQKLLKGHRILDIGEIELDGEEFVLNYENDGKISNECRETADEYYERICAEYDEMVMNERNEEIKEIADYIQENTQNEEVKDFEIRDPSIDEIKSVSSIDERRCIDISMGNYGFGGGSDIEIEEEKEEKEEKEPPKRRFTINEGDEPPQKKKEKPKRMAIPMRPKLDIEPQKKISKRKIPKRGEQMVNNPVSNLSFIFKDDFIGNSAEDSDIEFDPNFNDEVEF